MKLFCTYFKLEFKKSIKVLKKSVLSMALMLVVLGLGVAAVSTVLLQSQVFQIVNVALVVPEGEKMTRMAVRFIEGMDSVKSVCKFEYMEKDAAIKAMQEGTVQAVIDLPENFYEDVDSGINTPANIYVPKESALHVELFKELLSDGVSMLQTAEAGVYASLRIADEYPAPAGKNEIGNQAALLYMEEVMRRGGIFDKSVCSPLGAVDFGQYYYSALVLLALLMGGLNYGFLYQRQSRVVAEKLAVCGMGRWKMSLAKVAVMTGILWMTGSLIYAAACAVSAAMHLDFLRFHPGAVFGMFMLCAAMAAYFHAVYALAGNSTQGAAVVFALNIIMVTGSGLLVPAAYLPDMVGKIGAWMPLNAWSRYHLNLMFGMVSVKEIVWLLVLCAAGTGIGAVSLWKNT